jgi:hypothetical protein
MPSPVQRLVWVNDTALDRIRNEQSFQDFLAAQRASWERYKKLAQ